jgi:hypothetical protein
MLDQVLAGIVGNLAHHLGVDDVVAVVEAHVWFAHFAVIARSPLEYASFTYYFRTLREFFQWSIRTLREDSCPDQ